MKKIFITLTTLCSATILQVQAANVVLVSDAATPANDAWNAILEIAFNFSGSDTLTLGNFTDHTDLGNQATLEGADLIVFSRQTNSGNYNQTGEAAYWNGLNTSIIMGSNLLLRNSRLGWISDDTLTSGLQTGSETTLSASGASFFGLSAGANDLVSAGLVTTISNAVTFGDGTVYGTHFDGDYNSVFWDAGDQAANGDVFGGQRLFFGVDEPFTLSTDGETALTNAMNTLAIPEPSSVVLFGLALVSLLAFRRR